MGEIEKEIEEIWNQIFFTFSVWEAYETFAKVMESNEMIKKSEKVNVYVPWLIWRSCGENILTRLRRCLIDTRKGNLSLFQVLDNKKAKNPVIKTILKILKGEFFTLIENFQQDLKTFKKELEKFTREFHQFRELQTLFEYLFKILEELENLNKKIEKLSKEKELTSDKFEEAEKIKESLFKAKIKLEETWEQIERKAKTYMQSIIRDFIKEAGLGEEFEEFKETYKQIEHIEEAFYEIYLPLKDDWFKKQYQKTFDEIEFNKGKFKELKSEINNIQRDIDYITQSFVFRKLWSFINRYIVHLDKSNIDLSKKDFHNSITISFKEVHSTLEEVLKEIYKLLMNASLVSLSPVYIGSPLDTFTVFMIPWLQPACSESQKIEAITWINRDKENKFCEIQLTNNEWFQITNFPPEYEWEPGNEVAIFQSYNFENPAAAYIICNFSKKQWVKAMRMPESWVKP